MISLKKIHYELYFVFLFPYMNSSKYLLLLLYLYYILLLQDILHYIALLISKRLNVLRRYFSDIFLFKTFEEIQQSHWESLRSEWEREKQKILNGLTALGQESLDLTQNTTVSISENNTNIRYT